MSLTAANLFLHTDVRHNNGGQGGAVALRETLQISQSTYLVPSVSTSNAEIKRSFYAEWVRGHNARQEGEKKAHQI